MFKIKQIGCGCTRRVYAIDDNTVLKVAFNDSGKAQCLRENELYKQDEYKPYLAEIIAYDENKGEITMERLHDCCYMRKDNEEVSGYFPSKLIEKVSDNVLQVGYDKESRLKIFDYGEEVFVERQVPKELKAELWQYRLRLKK